MANLQALKRRIRSINNTLKTTAAMQLIASVKMRRAVEAAQQSRVFADQAERLLTRLTAVKGESHPLLRAVTPKKVLLVTIAADKGLCGAYNADVLRLTNARAVHWERLGVVVELLTLGRRALSLTRGVRPVAASFQDLGDEVELVESSPVGRMILSRFEEGAADRVEVIYKKFVSTLRQEATAATLIPVEPVKTEAIEPIMPYTFEPSGEAVLGVVLPFLVRSRLYQMTLEAKASEHAARMVAMQSATDSGRELSQDLLFTANSIRQEKITAEVAEITAGTAALT